MPVGRLRVKVVKGQAYKLLSYRSESGKRRERSLGRLSDEEATELREHGSAEVEFSFAENGKVHLEAGIVGQIEESEKSQATKNFDDTECEQISENPETDCGRGETGSLGLPDLKQGEATDSDLFEAQQKSFQILEKVLSSLESHPKSSPTVNTHIMDTREVLGQCSVAIESWFTKKEVPETSQAEKPAARN